MDNAVLERWLNFHMASQFFYDFQAWHSDSATLGIQTEPISEALLQEYDDLFKGTDSDIYIPLWASACAGKGDIIMDDTTLSVIEFYYNYGYRPMDMDGNPPDFIGQQFRFLAYLSACALHGGQDKYWRAQEEFISLYTLATANAVVDGIREYASSATFRNAAEVLSELMRNNPALRWPEGWQAAAERMLLESDTCAAYKNGQENPIKLGERKTISTAGRNNCGGKCVIKAVVQEGCLLHVATDDSELSPQIRACVRGRGYRQLYMTGKRLRYPMKRIAERGAGKFKRISWDEAVSEITEEWIRIRDKYGSMSRYVNYSFGVAAVLRGDYFAKRLLALDGGFVDYYNTYSFGCVYIATPYIYGDVSSGNSLEDMLNTKLLILWGHNPTETMFGSERNYYLAQLKEKGVRIVVIDPRFSDTAAFADEWIGIKPSSDGAMADAMAYVIWSEGLLDKAFMDKFCLGFDEDHMPEGVPTGNSYESYLFGKADGVPKTPQWAEAITGVPAETIARLAREYATAKPACIQMGWGPQRTGNGEQTTRSIAALTCLTANVGIPGGGAAGQGYVQVVTGPALPIPPNPASVQIPCFLWTKAVEHGTTMHKHENAMLGETQRLESDIKMVFNLGGNALVNQHSDINNTIRILKDTGKCEFIVCSDVFMTPSVKFADVLLPATSMFESDNMAGPWAYGAYILFLNKVIEPLFGCRFEYDWLREIANRLGHLEKFDAGHTDCNQWLKYVYGTLQEKYAELPDFETFKQAGIHKYKNPKCYVAYEQQISEEVPFSTPSGKIEIFSKRLYDMNNPSEIPAIPRYVSCPEGPEDPLKERFPLQLIGWHSKRSTHSTHYQSEWMEELEPHRLWINPQDAAKRSISDGETVEVFNDRGRVRLKASITERIIPDVVAMPQGAWYTPDKQGTDQRGSINVLTSFRPTPLAKGNPQHTNLVEVSKA
ncbi:MAG: molybdopterin-dependent oxidoreductase [Defluviitaleaceae bacterium]|nr:molybdopterin-dependent oxidoreductase [Defluviitaleaceae bacterium]